MRTAEEILCELYECEPEDLQLNITLNPSLETIKSFGRKFAKEALIEASEKHIEFKEISSDDLNAQDYQPFITADDGTIWVVNKESIINITLE